MYDLGKQFKVDASKLLANPDCIFQGDKYRITILTERLVRLEYNEKGDFVDTASPLVINRVFKKPDFSVREDTIILELETKYFNLSYVKNAPFKGTRFNPTKYLSVLCKLNQEMWYYGHPEIKNFHGNNRELHDFDEKKQNKENNGLYATDGFVSMDDSRNYVLNENGAIEDADPKKLDIYLFVHGKDLGFALGDYYKLTGMPVLLPRYALGNWWSSVYMQKYDHVNEIIDNFKERNIPISIFMFDAPWRVNKGEYGTFTPNEKMMTTKEMDTFIARLKKDDIKVGLNVNPKLKLDPGDFLYDQASQYLEKDDKGSIIFDLTRPKDLDIYLKFFIHTYEKKGIDFFWNDLQDKDLRKQWLVNHYQSLDMERGTNTRRMVLGRNSGIAAHRYPVLYSGKTGVSWKNFQLIPYFNVSSSNLGVNLWSHDIFGFEGGIEDPELYIRSVQLGVVSPILRFRGGPSKYYKREPWLWEEKTKAVVSRYLTFRHMLIPYLYTENYKYSTRGVLTIIPIYYTNPNFIDDEYYRNSYFFGSELFVAPITTRTEPIINRTLHRFFLPAGTWYDYFTGKKFTGNKKYLSFYREEDYPIFAKAGAIIPLSKKAEINTPHHLEIQVFPGESNVYNLYEDDGYSEEYKEGAYLITQIKYEYSKNDYTVRVKPYDGRLDVIPPKRYMEVRFKNSKEANVTVTVDGEDFPYHSHLSGKDFVVEIEDVPTSKELVVSCSGDNIEIDALRVLNDDIDDIIMSLLIPTNLKEVIANIMFSNEEIRRKRVLIRKLKKKGLEKQFIPIFLKLLDYMSEFK